MIYIVALLCCFIVIALNILILSGEYDHIIPIALEWGQDHAKEICSKTRQSNNALYNTKAKEKVNSVKDAHCINFKESSYESYRAKHIIYNACLYVKDIIVGIFSAIVFYIAIMLPYLVYTLIFGGAIYAIAYGIGYLWGSFLN